MSEFHYFELPTCAGIYRSSEPNKNAAAYIQEPKHYLPDKAESFASQVACLILTAVVGILKRQSLLSLWISSWNCNDSDFDSNNLSDSVETGIAKTVMISRSLFLLY